MWMVCVRVSDAFHQFDGGFSVRNELESPEQYRLRLILIRATMREIGEIKISNGQWIARCVDGWHEVRDLLYRARFNLKEELQEWTQEQNSLI